MYAIRSYYVQKLQASQRDWEIDGFKIDFMSKMYLDSDSPKGIRITSYNVCYTKLLRRSTETPPEP